MKLILLLTLQFILTTITIYYATANFGDASKSLSQPGWIVPFESEDNATDLCFIMNFWGSDRGHPLNQAKYSFTSYYSHVFSHHRHVHLRLLEIDYKAFGSLRGWKSYFSRGNIYGISYHNEQRIDSQEDRIHILRLASNDNVVAFNSSSKAYLGLSFEIIIDHAQVDMLLNVQRFESSISRLMVHGFYFIESIQRKSLSIWIGQLIRWKQRFPEMTMKIISFPKHESINSEDNYLLVGHKTVHNDLISFQSEDKYSHDKEISLSNPTRNPSYSSFRENKKTRKKRGKGDRNGLKVLIISSDTRPLKKKFDEVQDYVSAASVLNQHYANYHQYDYIKYSANYSSHYAREVMEKYHPEASSPEKIATSEFQSFNYAFQHFRIAPWTKVPFLWYALREYRNHYDYILFVDSDAAFNPTFLNRSISDALLEWNSSDAFFAFGARDIYQSNFIFLNNFPWRDDLPCTGVILVKANEESFQMLNAWWHYYIPGKNTHDFLEQDALWHMLESPSYHFSFNRSTVTLLLEAQLVSLAFGLNELWICHIPNYHAWNRIVNFRYL